MNAYELAQKEIGTVEWSKGDNPVVIQYFKDAGHPEVSTDATAWCAAFVGAMLARSGVKPTGKLNARSYLDWGVPIDRKDAKPGDVVIFERGTGWQGHVGFFVKDEGALIKTLGGNQSDAVNIKGQQASKLLGIRRADQDPIKKPYVKETPEIEHKPPPYVKNPGKTEHDAGFNQEPIKKPGLLSLILSALAAIFNRKGPKP